MNDRRYDQWQEQQEMEQAASEAAFHQDQLALQQSLEDAINRAAVGLPTLDAVSYTHLTLPTICSV